MKHTTKFGVLVSLLLALALPVSAQFIGYTSPQTVSQVIATTQSCSPSPIVVPVHNLGQTVHTLTLKQTVTTETVTATLEGSNDGVNFFTISTNFLGVSIGSITASGYYPVVQARIQCNNPATLISANYSGTSVTPGLSFADIDASYYLTLPLNGQSAGANFSSVLPQLTPYGNMGGELVFNYVGGAGPAGSTLSVDCIDPTNITLSMGGTYVTPTLDTQVTNPQIFPIPSFPCKQVQVAYFNGGASANTIRAFYLFTKPGNQTQGDPCASSAVPKSSKTIAAGAAATTKIVTESASKQIYVCGFIASQVATAGTVSWITGTGATCGTNTVTQMGPMGVTASQPFYYGGSGSTVFKGAPGAALCMTTTGAGGTVGGTVTFFQQ